METRSVTELIAEIPDGWEYTTSPKGDVVVCHPEHPPRIFRVGSEAWEELEFSEPRPGELIFGALRKDGRLDGHWMPESERLVWWSKDDWPDPKPSLLNRFSQWVRGKR